MSKKSNKEKKESASLAPETSNIPAATPNPVVSGEPTPEVEVQPTAEQSAPAGEVTEGTTSAPTVTDEVTEGIPTVPQITPSQAAAEVDTISSAQVTPEVAATAPVIAGEVIEETPSATKIPTEVMGEQVPEETRDTDLKMITEPVVTTMGQPNQEDITDAEAKPVVESIVAGVMEAFKDTGSDLQPEAIEIAKKIEASSATEEVEITITQVVPDRDLADAGSRPTNNGVHLTLSDGREVFKDWEYVKDHSPKVGDTLK